MLKTKFRFLLLLIFLLIPTPVFAMHIMEGFLPVKWVIFWDIVTIPFLLLGFAQLKKEAAAGPGAKLMLAFAGAFIFVLSALKMPSVTGSCSHPTGTGLAALLFGPFITTVLGFIVLIFQALLLAHGGITTLGANTFSMAVAGPLLAYGIYKGLTKAGVNKNISIFLAAMLGDLVTYIVTSVQLALAFPGNSFGLSVLKFMGIFALTQIPLAISEGILTVLTYNFLSRYEDAKIWVEKGEH